MSTCLSYEILSIFLLAKVTYPNTCKYIVIEPIVLTVIQGKSITKIIFIFWSRMLPKIY